jgi:transposase-like protein
MNGKKKTNGRASLRGQFSVLKGKGKLGDMIFTTMEEWYGAKHPAPSEGLVAFLNSVGPHSCPFCGSPDTVRDGLDGAGLRIRKCRSCGRKYRPLTGTVLASSKIPLTEWVEFLIHLFQLQSVSVSSLDNRNAHSTGIYWTRKVFRVLEGCQDGMMLGPVVFLDETYLSVRPSRVVRRDGRKLRGLSRNKICVMSATDGVRTVLIPGGTGKPSAGRIARALGMHIFPGSALVDDGEKSHCGLAALLGLERHSHPTSETKGMDDRHNPLEPINRVHRFFKRFMRSHGGYGREGVRDWCNLFSFVWNHGGDLATCVRDFLDMAVRCRNVMKYRPTMRKKP